MSKIILQKRSKRYLNYQQKKYKWTNIITAWCLSNLKPKQFCAEHNLDRRVFYRWRHKLHFIRPLALKQPIEELGLNVCATDFIPVKLDAIQDELRKSSEGIVLVLANGHQLAIKNDFQESTLIRLLSVLGGALC